MLDAVSAALEPKAEGSPSSEPEKVVASDPKAEAEKTAAAVKEDDLSPEDLKRLSVKAQKRYRELVSERVKAEAEVSALKPKAEQYDLITRQIRETGLDKADLDVGFGIMTALKKGDLFGARAKLMPIYEQVMRLTGGVLPKDLADEVEAKAITEARARELATARAAAEANANRVTLAQQEHEARQTQTLTASVVDSVNAWEKAKAAIDPDWKLKSPLIMQALQLSLAQGNRPKSPQEAIAMADAALAEVNERTRAFRPPPKAVKAVVGNGGGASNRNQAAPKTMLDVVSGVLG